MKRFALASVGVLCLMLAALIGSHLGNRTAEATVTTPAVGSIVAAALGGVVTWNGEIWAQDATNVWYKRGDLPFATDQLQFIVGNPPNFVLVDKSSNRWLGQPNTGSWTNYGAPPVSIPVPTQDVNFGTLKDQYKGD